MARKKTRKTHKSSKKTRSVSKKESKTSILIAIIVLAVLVAFLVNNPFAGEKVDEKAVAYINGEPVYNSELEEEINRLPPELQQTLDQNSVLSQLIDKNLLLAAAQEAGTKADEEIERIITESNITIEELTENVAAQGFTLEEFKDQLKVFLFLDSNVFTDLEVSDEEAATYYEANVAQFIIPESVRARHILVSTESRTDEEALEIMNEVQAAFAEDNTVFCELVTEYSEDPGSLSTCGEYPPFTREDPYVQEYKDAAFNNAAGESSVAKTQFGYHLIYTLEKTSEAMFAFEEIAEQLKSNLLFEKQKDAFTIYIGDLRENAEITNCLLTPEHEMCVEEEEIEEEEEIVEDVTEEDSMVTFAKCLTENGAKMYGAYWCTHCENQKKHVWRCCGAYQLHRVRRRR